MEGDWSVGDLWAIIEALNDFLQAAHAYAFDYSRFRSLMDYQEITLINDPTSSYGETNELGLPGEKVRHEIRLNVSLIKNELTAMRDGENLGPLAALKDVFIHELGHAWDDISHRKYRDRNHASHYNNTNNQCAGGQNLDTPFCNAGGGDMSDPTFPCVSDYACTNRAEDFAESVATEIYPGMTVDKVDGALPYKHGSQYYTPDGTQPQSKYIRYLLRVPPDRLHGGF